MITICHETRLPLNNKYNRPHIEAYATKTGIGFTIVNHAKLTNKFYRFVIRHEQQFQLLYHYHCFYYISDNEHLPWFEYLLVNITPAWSMSPYSNSFYNSHDITWNYKPENSLRISDHWNFTTSYGSEIHCQTTNPAFKTGWAVGEYHHGVYTIIKYL